MSVELKAGPSLPPTPSSPFRPILQQQASFPQAAGTLSWILYEANPMAMLIEQAGGTALAAPGQRILDVQPADIHQRTRVIPSGADEVDHVIARL